MIPVTIIGGYLGSGKTTLVNHLLRNAQGVRLTVMVNDFGELPIDADLIEARDGDIISLSGGCVCCSYGDDLSLSLHNIQTQAIPPDRILIEASGVALPGAIGKSLSLQREFRLDRVLVMADASSIQFNANQRYIADTVQRQLQDADLIIMNKPDLLPVSEHAGMYQWVNENFPGTPIVEALFGKVDSRLIYSDDIRDTTRKTDNTGNPSVSSHDASAVFTSVTLTVERKVDASALAARLAGKECEQVRVKGFVMDIDGTMKTIHVVGSHWEVTDAPTGVDTGLVCISCAQGISEKNLRVRCGLDAEPDGQRRFQSSSVELPFADL